MLDPCKKARKIDVGEEKFGRRFLNLLDRLEWEWWIFEWKLVPLQVVFQQIVPVVAFLELSYFELFLFKAILANDRGLKECLGEVGVPQMLDGT